MLNRTVLVACMLAAAATSTVAFAEDPTQKSSPFR